MLDLAAEGRYGGSNADQAAISRLQAMKTGAILAFSVEAGAILGRADALSRRNLLGFGKALGAAFQVADDILDREAAADVLGKRTGKDRDRGKATLVDLLGTEGARRECDRLVDAAVRALDGFGSEADLLRAAARFAVERSA
jgi:farnesyl diphosphate synthase